MNPKLQDAVAIFKELGWEGATPETVPDLPLGTPEQKRAALAGLGSGEWTELVKTGENTYGWQSHIDVDKGSLALFAIRIGVDARRAVNISYGVQNELLAAAVAQRGEKYAQDFIRFACVSRRRMLEHSPSVFGCVAVLLVDALDLEIPQSVEYLKDWSAYAAAVMAPPTADARAGKAHLPDLNVIERRFSAHILTGVAVGTPATGPFGAVLPGGVKRGWLPRDKGAELVFSALDAAVRPGDRKVWLDVLEELAVTDEELCERTQALISLLATGDNAVVARLAPKLIAHAEDDVLAEVLMACFSATAKKTRLLVLRSALERPCPRDAEAVSPWLSALAGDADRAVASHAVRLMERWGIQRESAPAEPDEPLGLWRQTPPVWHVPAFSVGDISPEALTALAAELANRPSPVHDVVTERFLAAANALAYRDADAARTSLRGLRQGHTAIAPILSWVRGEPPGYGFDKGEKDILPPLTARDYVVCLHLDKLPCLLSTPSADDLSIRLPDLAARLALYRQTDTHALEADLLLALTRLDAGTKTPEAVQALRALAVPIALQSGELLPVTAGQAVLRYLDTPIKEPSILVGDYGYWDWGDFFTTDALCGFPNRFRRYRPQLLSIFPHWGDCALGSVRWDSEVYHEKGLILRQVARRATPLPPGASINLLAAQRSNTPDAAEDAALAVTEAWERGLLRPGGADVALLDWSTRPPSNLVSLAAALDGIARDGLLSVVWPILDVLVEASLKAPRLLAGTAEIAGLLLAFLPEVQLAVTQGVADRGALYLPGIRALAGRGGASRAVNTAQKVVSLLPPAPAEPEKGSALPLVLDPPFDEVWPARNVSAAPVADGIQIAVDWAHPNTPTKFFRFTLTLPGVPDRVFQVVKMGWYYDLEREGQCQAYAGTPGAPFARDKEKEVWLHWDAAQNAMAVCEHRNWREGKDGPLKGRERPPLPPSLLTVIVGLLAQDGDAVYYAPRLLRDHIESGEIDEGVVRSAAQILLQSPVVSPAKLVRALEKDIRLLHVLWPLLTECVKTAGAIVAAGNPPPVWVNRILDISLRQAPYLTAAAERGLIPPDDMSWPGLAKIAASKAKSAAVAKAKKLLAEIPGSQNP